MKKKSKGEMKLKRGLARHRAWRCAAAILVLLGAAGFQELQAWGKTWMGVALQQAVSLAKWKLGPFRIAPTLYLTDAGYDTNLYYGFGGSPVKDYTLTAGPGFTVYLPVSQKIILQAAESPQYVYYQKTRSERTWNNYLSSHLNLAFNRIFISLGGSVNNAKQRWNTEVDIRPRRREQIIDGTILWQATKKTSFNVQGSRSIYDYENLEFDLFNLRDRLNRTEDRLSLIAYHQLTYRVRLFVEGQYATYTFERQASRDRDSRGYGVFGGFEFAPLGVIRGRINIGYKTLEPLNEARSGFRGLAGDSQVSVRLLKFLTVRTSYRRDIQFSIWYDNAYYVDSRAGGGASLYLFKKIRLDYDYWDGCSRYPESQAISPGTFVKRRDDYRIHSVGLYFRLRKNIGLGLVASRWNRDSNLEWEIDNRDFIGMNLTYDF
jgi:hypothetical protein